MEMKMDTNKYWPENRVYLFGLLAFLPESIENKALLVVKMRRYFPVTTLHELEKILCDYENKGYFKVERLDKAGEPRRYILTDINRNRFRSELSGYLKSIKLDEDKLKLLWDSVKRQRYQNGYEPVVRWRDIYGDAARFNYSPPFWELIFILVMRNWVRLISADYTKTVPAFEQGGVFKKTPEVVRQVLERPFVKIEIIDNKIKRMISKPRTTLKYPVSIILTPGGKLQLSINNKRHTIWSYKSEDSNTYRAAKALYDSNGEPLTKSGLNLKVDSKTSLKDIVKNMRFTGILAEIFIEYGRDQSNRQTVLLRHRVNTDIEQYERLLEYVNTL